MKIISKFKDYYDYLVGKYGEDPILVFDRRNNSLLPQGVQQNYLHALHAPPERWDFPLPAVAHSCLYVGNQAVYLFHTGQKVYTSFDLTDVCYYCTKRYRRYCVLTFRDGMEYSLGSYYFAPFENFRGWRQHAARLCMEKLAAHADNRSWEYQQPYRTIPPAAGILPLCRPQTGFGRAERTLLCGKSAAFHARYLYRCRFCVAEHCCLSIAIKNRCRNRAADGQCRKNRQQRL